MGQCQSLGLQRNEDSRVAGSSSISVKKHAASRAAAAPGESKQPGLSLVGNDPARKSSDSAVELELLLSPSTQATNPMTPMTAERGRQKHTQNKSPLGFTYSPVAFQVGDLESMAVNHSSLILSNQSVPEEEEAYDIDDDDSPTGTTGIHPRLLLSSPAILQGVEHIVIPEEMDPTCPSDEEESLAIQEWEMEPGPIVSSSTRRRRGQSPPPLGSQSSIKRRLRKKRHATSIQYHDPPLLVSPPPGQANALLSPEPRKLTAAVDPLTLAHFNKLKVQAELQIHESKRNKKSQRFEDRHEDVKSYKKLWKEFENLQQAVVDKVPNRDDGDDVGDNDDDGDSIQFKRSPSCFDLSDADSWYFDFTSIGGQGEAEERDDDDDESQSGLSLLSSASMESQRQYFQAKRRMSSPASFCSGPDNANDVSGLSTSNKSTTVMSSKLSHLEQVLATMKSSRSENGGSARSLNIGTTTAEKKHDDYGPSSTVKRYDDNLGDYGPKPRERFLFDDSCDYGPRHCDMSSSSLPHVVVGTTTAVVTDTTPADTTPKRLLRANNRPAADSPATPKHENRATGNNNIVVVAAADEFSSDDIVVATDAIEVQHVDAVEESALETVDEATAKEPPVVVKKKLSPLKSLRKKALPPAMTNRLRWRSFDDDDDDIIPQPILDSPTTDSCGGSNDENEEPNRRMPGVFGMSTEEFLACGIVRITSKHEETQEAARRKLDFDDDDVVSRDEEECQSSKRLTN